MQPIRLTLENFGPYEKSTIDFSDYYAQTLFLITGKTGSGKTTIFDGMTYALYGKTSGGLREGKEMRSNFAAPGEKTRVVFEFKQNKQTFIIEREPEQLVKKVHSDDFREQKNTARLTVFDEKGEEVNQLTKISEVDKFLVELVQLSRDQFSQIVMLPQGEFRRFLNADSNSKEIVLRKLFNTYFYKDMANTLKEKKKQWESEFKSLDQQVSAQLNQLEWQEKWHEELEEVKTHHDTLSLYAKQQESYDQELKAHQEETNKLVQKVKEQQLLVSEKQKLLDQFLAYQDLLTQLRELSEHRPQKEEQEKQISLLEKIEKIEPTIRHKEELKKEISYRNNQIEQLTQEQLTKEEELNQLNKTKDKLALKESTVLEEEKQLAKVEESLPLFEERQIMEKELTRLREELITIRLEKNQLVKQEEGLNQRREQIDELLSQESTLLVKKSDGNDQKREQENLIKVISELEQEEKQIDLLKQEINQLVIVVKEQEEKLTTLEVSYKQRDSQWAKAQIAKLSLRLVEGEACVVCGSTSHPHPFQEESWSEAAIEELELELKALAKEEKKSQETLTTLRGQLTFKEEALTDKLSLFKEKVRELNLDSKKDISLEEHLKVAKDELDVIEINLSNLVASLEDVESKKAEKEILVKELLLVKNQLEDIVSKDTVKSQEVVVLETNLANLLKRLPREWTSLEDMVQEKNNLEKSINDWRQNWQETNQVINETKLTLASVLSRTESEKKEQMLLVEKLSIEEGKLIEFSKTNQLELEELGELLQKLPLLSDLRQEIKEFDKEEHVLLTKKAELEEILKEQEQPEMSSLIEMLDKMSLLLDEKKEQTTKLTLIIENNQQIIRRVTKELADKKEAQTSLLELTELVDVMTGDGASKLSMERYVLQIYLKKILQRGNEKLIQLSNGRYQFEMKEEQGSSKKATGLEINIFDDNVGAIRSVNTLSGGESFIAALCLALSLAEIIQEEAGGIKIDAMFIDEGFGSLDEDALEMAIRALETIEGEGRIIGIISHVRELKERIPQQLQIVSENGKSRVIERLEFE